MGSTCTALLLLNFGANTGAQWRPCPHYASIGGAILHSYLRCNIIYLKLYFRPTSFWTSLPQNCHSFILLPNYVKMQWEILNGPDSNHIHQRVISILNILPWDAKITETTITTHNTGNGDQYRTEHKVISKQGVINIHSPMIEMQACIYIHTYII